MRDRQVHDVASPAAAFARRRPRARLRRLQRARTVVVSACALLAGVAWTGLVKLDWNRGLIIVPILVAATAASPFLRTGRVAPWAALLVRAALWGSFVCGIAAAFATHEDMDVSALLVATPAAAGLIALGRFSRALAGARPLLVALTAIALADATIHGLALLFVLLDHGTRAQLALVFGFICAANIGGLLCIRRFDVVSPHVLGNAVVLGLAVLDVAGVKPIVNAVIGGAALLQIVLALLLRTKPAKPRTRRAAEAALRIAVVLAWAVTVALALAD